MIHHLNAYQCVSYIRDLRLCPYKSQPFYYWGKLKNSNKTKQHYKRYNPFSLYMHWNYIDFALIYGNWYFNSMFWNKLFFETKSWTVKKFWLFLMEISTVTLFTQDIHSQGTISQIIFHSSKKSSDKRFHHDSTALHYTAAATCVIFCSYFVTSWMKTEGCLNIKMLCYYSRNSHYKNKTVAVLSSQ